MNTKKFFDKDYVQQSLLYFSIAVIILASIYIFFSFYIEIFLTLIFITLVMIYKKLK